MITHLRRLIREVAIKEAAASLKSAASAGLALHRFERLMFVDYTLYDPIEGHRIVIEAEDLGMLKNVPVFGFISVYKRAEKASGPCYFARQVGASAAEKGYGPLMYDIAMSDMRGFFVPDRDAISSTAASVWKYYDEQRTDVMTRELDDIADPKTPQPHDDCKIYDDPGQPELDKAYMLRVRTNLEPLFANNDLFIGELLRLVATDKILPISDELDVESSIEEAIRKAGAMHFFSKYKVPD